MSIKLGHPNKKPELDANSVLEGQSQRAGGGAQIDGGQSIDSMMQISERSLSNRGLQLGRPNQINMDNKMNARIQADRSLNPSNVTGGPNIKMSKYSYQQDGNDLDLHDDSLDKGGRQATPFTSEKPMSPGPMNI